MKRVCVLLGLFLGFPDDGNDRQRECGSAVCVYDGCEIELNPPQIRAAMMRMKNNSLTLKLASVT